MPQVLAKAESFFKYFGLSRIGPPFLLGNALAQTATPSPGSGILIKALPNPCILGSNNLCTSTITLSAGNNSNLQIKIRETGVPFTGLGFSPTGSQNAPWITAGGYNFDLYSNSTLIDSIFVRGVSSNASPSPSLSPSPSSSATASASPVTPVKTVSYKVAETEAGLASAQMFPYSEHPTVTNFTFSNTTPGSKQIWAEFIRADGSSQKEHISVELLEPDPVLTSLDCSMDISKQNLKLTLNGLRLGSGSGKIKANDKDAQILTWSDTQATATIKPEGSLEDGKLFKVVMTRGDGKILPETTCLVNTSVVSLGAKLFCRAPGTFDISGVKVTLVDEGGSKVNEEVTIDKDGLIKGLKTKLQSGKSYMISVKAPYSLRRNARFTAADGTTVISPTEESNFILPVGDIAPIIQSDGKINTLDHAEIIRQWSILGSANVRTGDFNQDGNVNSIDWACMRYDFNKEDDAIPTKATIAPSPTPTPTPTSTPSGGACPTPPVCPAGKTLLHGDPFDDSCPVYSCVDNGPDQRAAYFLLAPEATGSYKLNTEFEVGITFWSPNEAVNLLVGKLAFDPSVLEVLKIEKGGVINCYVAPCPTLNWTEDSFDNQAGTISLVAGTPNPGLRTAVDGSQLAKITFKSKKTGKTNIAITNNSKIYANSDNLDILGTPLIVQEVEIKP